jgi:hypothetical protein
VAQDVLREDKMLKIVNNLKLEQVARYMGELNGKINLPPRSASQDPTDQPKSSNRTQLENIYEDNAIKRINTIDYSLQEKFFDNERIELSRLRQEQKIYNTVKTELNNLQDDIILNLAVKIHERNTQKIEGDKQDELARDRKQILQTVEIQKIEMEAKLKNKLRQAQVRAIVNMLDRQLLQRENDQNQVQKDVMVALASEVERLESEKRRNFENEYLKNAHKSEFDNRVNKIMQEHEMSKVNLENRILQQKGEELDDLEQKLLIEKEAALDELRQKVEFETGAKDQMVMDLALQDLQQKILAEKDIEIRDWQNSLLAQENAARLVWEAAV